MFLQVEPRHRNALTSHSPTLNSVILSHRPLENINIILQRQAGMGALYLGDVVSTLKDNVLEMNKIKAILTCMAQNHHLSGKNIIHKVLPIKDTLEYPIHLHFNEAAKWIEEKRRQGINVLVHCHAGVSRSATIIIACLMRYKGWTALQALNYVRSKRERAKPNANFWNQLTQYQLTLNTPKEEQSRTEGKLLHESKLTQNNDPQSPTRQYTRRKIFQSPPIEQNHYLRQKNVISTEYLPPNNHYQRHSQSIVFNNHNRSDIYENRSAVQPRMINNSFMISQSRILTPPIQGQPLSNSPSTSHLHYNAHNYLYKQKAISPFYLDYSRTH